MATKGRINVIVAPAASVDVVDQSPGGTNGVLFIDSTGDLNRLKLVLPNGDIKTSSVDSSGAIAFV